MLHAYMLLPHGPGLPDLKTPLTVLIVKDGSFTLKTGEVSGSSYQHFYFTDFFIQESPISPPLQLLHQNKVSLTIAQNN